VAEPIDLLADPIDLLADTSPDLEPVELGPVDLLADDPAPPIPIERPRDVLQPDVDTEFVMARQLDLVGTGVKNGFLNEIVETQTRSAGETIKSFGAAGSLEAFRDDPSQPLPGVAESLVGIFRSSFDAIDQSLTGMGTTIEADSKTRVEDREAKMIELLGPDPSLLDETLLATGTSIGASSAALAAGLISRGQSTLAAVSSMGYFTYAGSRQRALDEGLSEDKAVLYGALDGIVEGGTELLPMKVLFGNKKVVAKLASFMAREMPSELLATTLQDLNEWMMVSPETPWVEFKEKLQHDLLITLTSTPLAGGAQVGTVQGIQRGVEAFQNRKKIGDASELSESETDQESNADTFNDEDIAPEVAALMQSLQTAPRETPQAHRGEDPAAKAIREISQNLSREEDVESIRAVTKELIEEPPQTKGPDRFDAVVKSLGLPSESLRGDLDTWNRIMDLTGGLVHFSRENEHIPGVLDYQGDGEVGAKGFWTTKTTQVVKANETLKAWRQITGWTNIKQLKEFDIYLREADAASDQLGRALNEQELTDLRKNLKLNLSEEAISLADRVWGNYRDSLSLAEHEVRLAAARSFGENDPAGLAAALEEITTDFNAMKDRNYMPHTRFGKYTIELRATEDTVIEGQEFEKDQVVYYEAFENKSARKKAEDGIRKNFANEAVILGKGAQLDDKVRALQGVPPSFARRLAETMNFTPEQQEQFNQMMFELAPANSFKKKMMRRAGIPGFDRDSRRVYADYFQRFSNHLARLKHNHELDNALSRMENSILRMKTLGEDSTERERILTWFKEHREYLNNPGNELANLRALGFTWYLGFQVKSAFVNLTQLPLVSFPHLAAIHGDIAATKELSLSMGRRMKYWQKGQQYSQDIQDMFEEGRRRGILEESAATEMAGVSEGSNIQRFTGGRFVGSEKFAQGVRDVATAGAWMFSFAEKQNRYITADAAYQLAKRKGDSHSVAMEKAFDAVERTQFEYARFNRPKMMRGKKAAFFLFFQYMTNMMWFIGSDKGRWRYLGMLFAAAGAGGLPFAEDAMDLLDAAMTFIGKKAGWKNPKFSSEATLKEAVQDINDGMGNWEMLFPDSDAFFEGFGSELGTSLGLNGFDISGSLSLGDIIPGTEIPNVLTGGARDPNRALNTGIAQAGGALANIPFNVYHAFASDEPDVWKKLERVMPSAGRSISRSIRFAARGAETERLGNEIVEFDPTSIKGAIEIALQAGGFAPTRLNRERNRRFKAREVVNYYTARRTVIFELYDYAIVKKNPGALKHSRERIEIFNATVPYPELKISGRDLRASLKNRQRRRALAGQDVSVQKRYRRLYKEQLDIFGEPLPSEDTP